MKINAWLRITLSLKTCTSVLICVAPDMHASTTTHVHVLCVFLQTELETAKAMLHSACDEIKTQFEENNRVSL